MAAVRMQRDNIQRYIWLMSGLLCLLLAFIFWLMTDKEQLVEVKKRLRVKPKLRFSLRRLDQ